MNLLETDFYVTKPVLAIHVPFGKGRVGTQQSPIAWFCLILQTAYVYTFENKKTIVCKKRRPDLYAAKQQLYCNPAKPHRRCAAKNIFAINFLISTDEKFEPFKITLKKSCKN